MPRNYTNVIVEHDQTANVFHILAPDVGYFYRSPELGAYLKKGSLAGLLKRNNQLYHLNISDDIAGFVQHIYARDIVNPVQYRQELYYLVAGQSPEELDLKHERTVATDKNEGDIPDGVLPILSPTDGIFYRRPHPDSPPYVEEGDEVSLGQVLGLVEVMKSFNQIKFWGPDFPAKARVVKIFAADTSEIRSLQALFWLEPL